MVIMILAGLPGAAHADYYTSNVELVSKMTVTGGPRIYAAGKYLYFVRVKEGIEIFEKKKPGKLEKTGELKIPDASNAFFSDGTTAFISLAECGVQMINIENPASPVKLSEYNTVDKRWNDKVKVNLIYAL